MIINFYTEYPKRKIFGIERIFIPAIPWLLI
jgi:hypothetical protein